MTAEVVAAFLESVRGRRCSEKYVSWLRYTLGHLVRAERLLPDRPEPVERVLAELQVGDETAYGVWVSLRLLYRWAAARLGVRDVMSAIGRPVRRPKVPRSLTQQEVDQLLWVNRRRPRDYALLRVLLDTGARIGEVAGLGPGDLSRDDHGWTLRLCGKTGEHEVPVSEETGVALRRLGPCWVDGRGRPLAVGGLQKAVQRALARAGLSGGPHLLRHTYGKLYVLNGGDLVSLQRLMGHRSVATTRRYFDLDLREVRRQHARFSPLAGRSPDVQERFGEVGS